MSYVLIEESGPKIASEADAIALIGDAVGADAATVAIPVTRLGDAFFNLSTGLLGAVTQKFQNYSVRLVIIGDIAAHLATSRAFRDFVREAAQRDTMWFVTNETELKSRLDA